jgi:hypothetical protein
LTPFESLRGSHSPELTSDKFDESPAVLCCRSAMIPFAPTFLRRAVRTAPLGGLMISRFLDRFPLSLFVLLALTLGLAPYLPEPHVLEKLKMLVAGALVRPVDIFDLLLHGLAWVLLALELLRLRRWAG